ncbi:hypothetical protein [Luteibacter sp. 329MFSha]|uniref:hypothetical protein n=1 Tax=Luteibacter sp. 329MFSha TaxID=1798239 RepID=UPI0008C99270|nr:hypothetical protein [Luteibacter sp. 329MFSha]SEW05697.1 hypothetical protein SAMN04515660_2166 [Luteibacter sp. 329MFSha]
MDLDITERWHRRLVFACLFVLATLMHLLVALLTLGARTSCAWPPCHDAWVFRAWSWLWSAPIFVTPWARLPIEEIEFAWTPGLVAMTVANSVLAVGLLVIAGAAMWHVVRVIRGRVHSPDA